MRRMDLSKVAVDSRASDTEGRSWSRLGDPMRWGSDSTVRVPAQLGTFASQQLIRVQCADNYARNWQIVGNVSANTEIWSISEADLQIVLEVALNAGQATLLQYFNLRALIDLAAPWYVDGGFGSLNLTKAWAIAGGLVGHALQARVLVRALNATHIETTHTIGITAVASPYAGAGAEPE